MAKAIQGPNKRVRKGLLVALGAGTVVTSAADRLVGVAERGGEPPTNRKLRRSVVAGVRAISSAVGLATVVLGGVTVATVWASWTTDENLWSRRLLRDLGSGPVALLAAVVGWDLIYYWNHRFMHESRFMWAIHMVHHSSERLNLATALRQPVAQAFGTFIPTGTLALMGVRPDVISLGRAINLAYQYWIHTEVLDRLEPIEGVLNTPSHHRVHHGRNAQYIDRNHGSILIVWDRLFGTFEPEGEKVVYGLTTNIDSFNPVRIVGREYINMLRDVAGSHTWRERLSYVLRRPGWTSQPMDASATDRPTVFSTRVEPAPLIGHEAENGQTAKRATPIRRRTFRRARRPLVGSPSPAERVELVTPSAS